MDRSDDGQLITFRGPVPPPEVCAMCPAARNGAPPHSPVRGFGPRGSLVVVGEGPSTDEIFQQYPFVGPSGRLLTKALRESGIDRNCCYITNVLLCRRPADDAAMLRAVTCCHERLRVELTQIAPAAIVALGGTAIHGMGLSVQGVLDARGTIQCSPWLPAVPVVSTLHPADILRGGAGEAKNAAGSQKNVDASFAFIVADIAKAWRISIGELPAAWSDDILVVVPEGCGEGEKISHDYEGTTRDILEDVRAWGMLCIDLEWDQYKRITWVGIGCKARSVSFWWPDMPEAARQLLVDAMADESLPKLMHNLQADKGMWEAHVGPMNGICEDSMIGHHAAYPGVAHDLQQVAAQFLPVPPWKAQHRAQVAEDKKAAREAMKAATRAKKQVVRDAKSAQRAANKAAKEAERLAKAARAAACASSLATFFSSEKTSKKDQKAAEHGARNAASAAAAAGRKAKRMTDHEARNDAAAAKAAEAVAPVPVPRVASCDPRQVGRKRVTVIGEKS